MSGACITGGVRRRSSLSGALSDGVDSLLPSKGRCQQNGLLDNSPAVLVTILALERILLSAYTLITPGACMHRQYTARITLRIILRIHVAYLPEEGVKCETISLRRSSHDSHDRFSVITYPSAWSMRGVIKVSEACPRRTLHLRLFIG